MAYSSFESMSNQLPQDQWSLSSDAAYYRNWPVDLVIRSYFGEQEFNATGEKAFKKQVRLDPCLLACVLPCFACVGVLAARCSTPSESTSIDVGVCGV